MSGAQIGVTYKNKNKHDPPPPLADAVRMGQLGRSADGTAWTDYKEKGEKCPGAQSQRRPPRPLIELLMP